jgi:hypothetical protein
MPVGNNKLRQTSRPLCHQVRSHTIVNQNAHGRGSLVLVLPNGLLCDLALQESLIIIGDKFIGVDLLHRQNSVIQVVFVDFLLV